MGVVSVGALATLVGAWVAIAVDPNSAGGALSLVTGLLTLSTGIVIAIVTRSDNPKGSVLETSIGELIVRLSNVSPEFAATAYRA